MLVAVRSASNVINSVTSPRAGRRGLRAAVVGLAVVVGLPMLTEAPAEAAGARAAATPLSESRLTWAPPKLSKPVTYRVSGDGPGVIRARAGQDSIVVFRGAVHRRIRMEGGRHWIVRGGEISNDKPRRNVEEQSGFEFRGVTGTAFVEGVLIHGRYGKDGIRVAEGDRTTLVVQNSRIVDRVAGSTGYHADVIQPYGGIKALKVDRMTGSGDFQGLMWKQEPGTRFGPTDMRRVNFRTSAVRAAYMIKFIMSRPTGRVTLTHVYNEPGRRLADGDFCRAQVPARSARCGTDASGRKYVTWSRTRIAVDGRITQGVPPGGDFVPPGVAGLRYVSPGYR